MFVHGCDLAVECVGPLDLVELGVDLEVEHLFTSLEVGRHRAVVLA